MTVNWLWATAFMRFTAIREQFRCCLTRVTLASSTPFPILMSWFFYRRGEAPWLSPIYPVGEASSGLVKGEASPPCAFMGSQRWFTARSLSSKLSCPLAACAEQHFTLLLLLVREPLLAFFFFSKWVTNGSTDIDVLCGWMVPPVLNCCYCNYEAHPASLRDCEKRQLAHIVLILTEICSIWIVCNMNFDVLHECQ